MFRKFIITLVFSLSIFVLCSVPSYASTMTEEKMAIEQIRLCWQTSTSRKNVISYDSLTSLCSDLNRAGYPCEIRFVSALNGYAILGTGYVHNTYESSRVYPLQDKYYSNIEGSIFYTPYQSDSLLSGIFTYVSSISSNFDRLMAENGYLRAFNDSLNSIVSHLSSISSSFARLMAENGYLRAFYDSFNSINSRLDTVIDQLSVSSPGSGSSGGSSSVLPNEYRRLTCVETTGQQYINSSIYFDSSKAFQIDADVEFTNSSAAQVLFGYSDDSNFASYALFLNPHPPTENYCFRFGSDIVTSSGAFPTFSRHSVISYAVSGRQYLSIDGETTLSSSVSSSFIGSVPCYIFGTNSSSGSAAALCYVRCYGIVIRQDGNIIRNYVPVIRYADNVPGLYDLVSGVFSPSSGQPFLAGSVLANWEYNLLSGLTTRLDSIIGNLPGSSSDLSSIESALSTIIDKMDNLPSSVENIDVNISNDNSAYNVFYVTDENGGKHSVTSVAADSLSASGKLLQFLYKLFVDGALSGVDSAVDGLNDFFFDSLPGSIGEGGSVWD